MSVDDLDAAYQAFRDLIVAHLLQKGWKRLLGKRIRYEQSLFEHSLNTLDVVVTYLLISADGSKPRDRGMVHRWHEYDDAARGATGGLERRAAPAGAGAA
jgi:hypothetical protein